jgi:glycosyltransferase involved in cell wall biosynthesis
MSADRVDDFIDNSFTVAKRIQKYYRREAIIINPPVEIEKFQISPTLGDYYLCGGRLVPYKKIDLVIKVFNRLGFPLKIFGDGPELKHLKKIAKPNIQFLGRISEEKKVELMSKALAFINPQLEDFGITAIESMAAGRPVIAYGVGGAQETVVDGETGVLFKKQTWESLFDTVLNFHPENWDSEKIRAHAEKFSEEIFKEKMKKFVEDKYEEFKKGLEQKSLF